MIVAPHIADACLSIDLGALVENYLRIRRATHPAQVAAVVKSDAYGIGAEHVIKALSGVSCRTFFVAQLIEAMRIKPRISDQVELFILNGLAPGAESACAQIGAIPVLNSLDQIKRWSAMAVMTGATLPAALQVDTGMSRLGLPDDEFDALLQDRSMLVGLEVRLIMTHFACADDPSAPANVEQIARFEDKCRHFPEARRSIDNSGGALQNRRHHYDVVRAGIALYGGAPHDGDENPMQPVVALDARIVQVRTIEPGAGVGYSLTFRAERQTRIATISIGYADGWPRHLSNKGAAYISGHRAPIAGRVSMDSICLDVTDIPEHLIFPGALVEMLGPNQSIDDVAAAAGTISYEILTQLGTRYARQHLPAMQLESEWSIYA